MTLAEAEAEFQRMIATATQDWHAERRTREIFAGIFQEGPVMESKVRIAKLAVKANLQKIRMHR